MAFTYNVTTVTGQMRLVLMDNQADSYIYEDEELEILYALEHSNLRRACALALEGIASNEAYVLKRITSLDLSTDGPAVAKELRERAAQLRAEALDDEAKEDGGSFDIAEWVVDPFTRRQRILNQALRDNA